MKKFLYATALTALGLAIAYNFYFTYDYVHVRTDKGSLRGFNSTTWRGTEVFVFKGIPYAEPPVGKLRFKGPVEESSWVGIRDAVSHGSVCPHLDLITNFLRGQEDCLYLNVYTPKLGDERLPVMVWVHGGGFTIGSGNEDIYGGDYFVDSGVVLVTLNYRLGALGFLSTGDDGAPGNAGLKDQVAALKWVKRNIARFGGDPDNVTLFGESAGGASVHYHLLSPMSSGLFKRAISQSGSALNPWAYAENGPELTIRLAEALGAEELAGDTTRALKYLRAEPYGDIIKIQGKIRTAEEERKRVSILFAPSLEKGVESEEVFLPDTPYNILKSGKQKKIPYLTGTMTHEGYLFLKELTKPETMKRAIDDTERFVPTDIANEELRRELGESIRNFYFDDKPIENENISNLVDLYTDITFTAGINRATELQLRSSETPVYVYQFSYDGGLNLLKFFFRINLPGAAHGDELGYLFYHKIVFWRKPGAGSEEEYVMNTMIRLWTNFAKYGNPTPAGDPLIWKPATLRESNYLHISGWDTKPEVNPSPARSDFWTKAYEKHVAL